MAELSQEDFDRRVNKAKELLEIRYKECNEKGHLKPDEENNICNYCYRTIDYGTPQADAMIKNSKELPLMQRPLNASRIFDKRNQEILRQKLNDNLRGLAKITQELNL